MKSVNKVPIWFMRQAGRYLPEYMAIRERERDFLSLCLNPKLAAEIALQPIRRFDFDFIILFCDILVIPFALGQRVSFLKNHGPILDPISSKEDLQYNNYKESIKKISNVFDTIQLLNQKKGKRKLIGFCGGPFTILNYMIEGGTSKEHKKILTFVQEEREKAKDLIKIIQEISIEYLKRQIKHGADYIQVFESWAGLLDGRLYNEFIIKPNKEISKKIREFSTETQIIHFPRRSGKKYIKFVKEVECDVISIDETCPDTIMREAEKKSIAIQGNMNPIDLLGDEEELTKKTIQILDKFKHNKHIFNLSHGILPETPIKNVEQVIKLVRNHEFT